MMGTGNFTDGLGRDAVAQTTARRNPVGDVLARPGVSKRSLCTRKRQYVKAAAGNTAKDVGIPHVRAWSI